LIGGRDSFPETGIVFTSRIERFAVRRISRRILLCSLAKVDMLIQTDPS
jgi:hypothetical protein